MPEPKDREHVSPEGARDAGLVGRRSFVATGIGLVGAGYAGAIGYPIYRYVGSPVERADAAAAVTEVALPGAEKLEPGSAMMFKFGTRPAMLIHHRDGSWSSFDAVCTHLGCTVQFEADEDRIFCACHGGVYDSHTGEPLAGPPPRGLTRYQVEVQDDRVIVARG
jgi:cytochrome b6-f complex iron-sulfur subunit